MAWTLSEIVTQLHSCDYECEAGLLTRNVAFIALEQMAEVDAQPAVSFLGSTYGPNGETPEQRSARYLETARRLARGFEGQQQCSRAAGPQREEL